MAKWRTFKSPFVDSNPSSRRAALNAGKARASQLLDRGQTEAALAILEPLAADYQNDSDLQMMLGMCHASLGDPDAAVSHYERAYALDKIPVALFPMGLAYLQLAMYGSALHAFDESKRRGLPPPGEMQTVLEQLRQDVGAMAGEMGLSMEKAIAGLREMERGTRWLERGDYARAIEANRAAIRLLGKWPVPHNNLASRFSLMDNPPQLSPSAGKSWRTSLRISLLHAIWCASWRGVANGRRHKKYGSRSACTSPPSCPWMR